MVEAHVARRLALAACLVGAMLLSFAEQTLSYRLLEAWIGGALPLMLLALAAGVVISCGRIDISSGAAMSALGMIILWGGGLGLFLGPTIGIISALCYLAALYSMYQFATKAGVPSIIATLAGLLISKGLAIVIHSCMLGVGEICRVSQNNTHVATLPLPPAISAFLDSLIFSIILVFSVVGALTYWRYRTRSGLKHVAVGLDESAADFARINIDLVRAVAFSIAAALVLLATVTRLYGQNNGGWAPNTGWGEELIAIAIAVIGGARVTGGRFDPIGIGLAAIVVYVLRDIIINDLGIPTEASSILFGIVLIAISWADLRGERRLA